MHFNRKAEFFWKWTLACHMYTREYQVMWMRIKWKTTINNKSNAKRNFVKRNKFSSEEKETECMMTTANDEKP